MTHILEREDEHHRQHFLDNDAVATAVKIQVTTADADFGILNGLVWFYNISTIVDYLMLNPFLNI